MSLLLGGGRWWTNRVGRAKSPRGSAGQHRNAGSIGGHIPAGTCPTNVCRDVWWKGGKRGCGWGARSPSLSLDLGRTERVGWLYVRMDGWNRSVSVCLACLGISIVIDDVPSPSAVSHTPHTQPHTPVSCLHRSGRAGLVQVRIADRFRSLFWSPTRPLFDVGGWCRMRVTALMLGLAGLANPNPYPYHIHPAWQTRVRDGQTQNLTSPSSGTTTKDMPNPITQRGTACRARGPARSISLPGPGLMARCFNVPGVIIISTLIIVIIISSHRFGP